MSLQEYELRIFVVIGCWASVFTVPSKPALPFFPGYSLADPRSNVPGLSPWNITVTTIKPALYRPPAATAAPRKAMLQKGRSMYGWGVPQQSSYNYQPVQAPAYQGYGWGYNNHHQPSYQWHPQGSAPAAAPAPSYHVPSYGWNSGPQHSYASSWSHTHHNMAPAYHPPSPVRPSYWAPTAAPNRWIPQTTLPPKSWYGTNNYGNLNYGGHQNNHMIPQAQAWMFPNIPTPPPYTPVVQNASLNQHFNWRPAAPAPMPWQKKPWPPPASPSYMLSMPPPPNSVDYDRATFEQGINFQDVRSKHNVGILPTSVLDGYCVYPFSQLDTGCYYFSDEVARDWETAKQQCFERKADLAKMDTFNNAEVMKLFMRMQMLTQANYYIALQLSDEGEWIWVKGNNYHQVTSVTYASWCSGEPKPGNRKCGALEPTPPSDRMCWRAEPCKNPHKEMHFICEKTLSNGLSQRRAVAAQNFWRESFWLPGYVKVLEEYGNIIAFD